MNMSTPFCERHGVVVDYFFFVFCLSFPNKTIAIRMLIEMHVSFQYRFTFIFAFNGVLHSHSIKKGENQIGNIFINLILDCSL